MDAKGKGAAAPAKGQQKGKAPDAYGKGPATHDQRGGGGASVFRDNLRCLWQSYNPEMPYNVFMHNLISYTQSMSGLNLGLHESHRKYLERVKEKVDAGLSFFPGWTAFNCRLDSLHLQAGQPLPFLTQPDVCPESKALVCVF